MNKEMNEKVDGAISEVEQEDAQISSQRKQSIFSVRNIAKIALLSALAYVLLLIEFPIFASAPHLRLNISDMPALIGAFLYGPIAGVVITLVKLVLFFFTGTSSAPGVGELANLIVGVSFVVPAGLIYMLNKNLKQAIIALVVSSLFMIIAAYFANLYILFPFYHIAEEVRQGLLWSTYVPFNAIKAVVTCVIAFFAYKPVHKLFNRF